MRRALRPRRPGRRTAGRGSPGWSATTWHWCSGPVAAGRRRPRGGDRRDRHDRPAGLLRGGRRRPLRQDPLGPVRGPAAPGLPQPHPLLRGAGRCRRRPRRADGGPGRVPRDRADQRVRWPQAHVGARHPGAHQRPHQPDRPLPIVGATFVDLTDLYSSRLRALCHEVDPLPTTRASRSSPAPLRDAGRGPDGRGHRWAPGGHEHHPRAIAAREAGMEVLGISLVTNLAAGIGDAP